MSEYNYWNNALKGEFGPIHDSDPRPGFYRKRTGRAAGYIPVAIWDDFGMIVAIADGERVDANSIWTYVADKPITEAQYRARVETGKWWDEDDAVTASIGHNNAPTDPAEILSEQITAALAGVDAYTEVKDDDTAAKAQSLRSRLLELSRESDKIREAKKAPHLEAGKSIDALFQPLIKASKAGADTIAKALSAHETAKAREAARLEVIAAEAHRKAQGLVWVTVEPEPAPPPPIPAPAPIKGSYGRGASVKVVKVATVVDQGAAYDYLKSQPELSALILKLAQKAVDAGFTVPGVTVEEQRKVS